MTKLSKDFDSLEFTCGCGCGYDDINPKLVDKLQMLRDLVNKPIIVTSGCRCKAYNKTVGGGIKSPHLEGLAVDCYTAKIDLITLVTKAKEVGLSRIGLYKNFLHLDIVMPHPSTSWVRDKKGKYHYFMTLEKAILFAKSIKLW